MKNNIRTYGISQERMMEISNMIINTPESQTPLNLRDTLIHICYYNRIIDFKEKRLIYDAIKASYESDIKKYNELVSINNTQLN